MNKFICTRCHLNTHIRTHFKRHLMRKNICKPIYTDTPIKSIAESYGIDISFTDKSNVTPNVTIEKRVTVTRNPIPNTSSSPISNDSIKNVTIRHHCDYCNKSFATRQGKYRHKKQCKYVTDKTNKTNKRTYTQEEVDHITEAKAEVIADKKAQKMVLCLVDKLVPNQTTNSHNTNSHNTQNTQNNINNIQNNNNNNHLKINNFGKEKTKYITDDKLKIMFVDPRNVVVQHIKDTYYHVLHPENFNAKITNCKSKHMHIFKETDWEKVNKQLTICSMYNKHEKIIENEFERLKPELTDTVRDNYNEYKKSTLHSFSTFKHRMIDIEAVIINGTKNHKKIDILSEKEVARLAKEQGKTPGEIFAEHMPDIFAERDGY